MTVTHRPRYARIEQLVGKLLVEHEVIRAPVPIEKMVEACGIKLKIGDLDDVSGLLVRKPDEVVIAVNSRQHRTRRRFTMAHEFGHYLLHTGISVHYDRDFRVNYRSEVSSQGTRVEEVEANFFAASLLMPKAFLDSDHAEQYVDFDDAGAAKDLADRYNVSNQAMNLRLLNLYGSSVNY
jgi:Zn-dependent peptidase ImmA (M78 family)